MPLDDTPLKLMQIPLGDYQTNAYVLFHEEHPECWIFDPGYDPGSLIDAIETNHLVPTKIILTHAHMDHIGGLDQVSKKWPDAPLLQSEIEKDWLTTPSLNLSLKLASHLCCEKQADGYLSHGEQLELHGMMFEIRHVPGHSPGSLIFYHADAHLAIVGDTLFHNSIGRTDFPTSDGPLLIEKIKSELFTLPEETICCPGHGMATQIAYEKSNNPFLR